MTNMNPEMMSDPILWQVALTMENGTDTIKELDSTADLDRVQEIYSEVLTFAADQAVLVPFTSLSGISMPPLTATRLIRSALAATSCSLKSPM